MSRDVGPAAFLKPLIAICLLLLAGSIVMIPMEIPNSKDIELLNTSNIHEDAYRSMQSQFIENIGQIDNVEVLYYCDLSGFDIGFTHSGVILTISSQNPPSESTTVYLNFLDSNDVVPTGSKQLTHKSNYFIGNDPDEWYTGIRSFREIVYPNLYDNINLIYKITDEGFKYEFIVYPGGNPSNIRLQYSGIDGLSIDQDASLVASTPLGPLKDSGLFIFQEDRSICREIAGAFLLTNEDSFGFQITEDYDKTLPLIIDPFLYYSTFIGGDFGDYAEDIVRDSENNVYVTGRTSSLNFPVTPGANDTTSDVDDDVFILKLSADGSTLIYSTYVAGGMADRGEGITIDSMNNVYVTGSTGSSDFPITDGANDTTHNNNDDVFILKLSADGSTLLYSTFVGSTDYDVGREIDIDAANNVYVTGYTYSSGFPTTSGANDTSYNDNGDVFILKLSSDGSTILFSTFAGGEWYDYGYDIRVDSSNHSYVTGETNSVGFPTTHGAYNESLSGQSDAFILKLSADGSTLNYSTFIGGALAERAYSIEIDTSGCAYITGFTQSSGFPVTQNAFNTTYSGTQDAFIVKLSANGSNLEYSTFVGGNNYEQGMSLALDEFNDVYLLGYTESTNFPTSSNANDTTFNGDRDVFILKLRIASASLLLYSSYIGGSTWDYSSSMVLANSSNIYITGYTESSDYPTTKGANDTTLTGSYDVFVSNLNIPPASITIDSPLNMTYSLDVLPVSYSILCTTTYNTYILFDGVANSTAFPTGSSWSDLSDGTHNLTIVVTTLSGDTKETTIFSIDTTPPDLDSPLDLINIAESIGNYIHWTIGDSTYGNYTVGGNGTIVALTSYSGSGTLAINIDGLAVGFVYNHTITVYDEYGNGASDTVYVKVIEGTELSSPSDGVIELGSTGNSLTWTLGNVWWPLPSYRIDGNGTTIDWSDCEDQMITISIDGLELGIWNFTISLIDQYDHIITDTVFITVHDTTSPLIDSPAGLTYEEGETGNNITWFVSDLEPHSYELYRNGTSIESDFWVETNITVDVDGLDEGTYLYTLIVMDTSGNVASDNVTVFVMKVPETTTTPITTITTTTPTETSIPTNTTEGYIEPGVFALGIIGSLGAGIGIGAVIVFILIRKRP